MNPLRQNLMETLAFALLASFLAATPARCQSGPPPLPPYPSSDALNFWPLESPPWSSEYADLARGFTNLSTAESWDYSGTSLDVDTNVPAFLNYEVFESYGVTNFAVSSN